MADSILFFHLYTKSSAPRKKNGRSPPHTAELGSLMAERSNHWSAAVPSCGSTTAGTTSRVLEEAEAKHEHDPQPLPPKPTEGDPERTLESRGWPRRVERALLRFPTSRPQETCEKQESSRPRVDTLDHVPEACLQPLRVESPSRYLKKSLLASTRGWGIVPKVAKGVRSQRTTKVLVGPPLQQSKNKHGRQLHTSLARGAAVAFARKLLILR